MKTIAVLFVLIFLWTSSAHAVAPIAILTAAQKAAVSFKCAVGRYANEGPNAPPVPAFQNSYPHCFKMTNRYPSREYRWKVISAADNREHTFVLLPSGKTCGSWTPPDSSHLYNCIDGIVDTASANGFEYHFKPHLWCRDPNPVKDLNTGAVVPTCRPFAFTLCTDPNGNTIKGAQLADMPSQICPSAQYEAKWYSEHNIDDPPP